MPFNDETNRPESTTPSPDSPRSASVLIVDDRAANLVALEAVLAPLEVRIVRADSGRAALEHVLREDFAVIVLDVQMPEMDGFETADLIRQRERSRDVPIIFVTAIHRDESYALRGYEHGAMDYLAKPFDPNVLRAKVTVLADMWKRGELSRMEQAARSTRERDELLAREQAARLDAETARARIESLTASEALASKRAESLADELRASESRTRRLQESGVIAVVTWKRSGTITSANDAFLRMLGYTRDDVTAGKLDWRAMTAAESVAADARAFAELDEHGACAPYEKTLLARAGHRVPVLVAAAYWEGSRDEGIAWALDITARKRAEDSLSFLADASTALAASIDYNVTLATVARLCVPAIADWAAVDMVTNERTLHRLAVAHVDPAKVELAHELWRRWPPRLEDPHGVPHVLRTREPEVFYEISDDLLSTAIVDPELLTVLRELGLRSSMVVPLLVRGRAVGAISLVAAESGRRFGEADVTLALELARRAGTAIEHATAYREAQEANRLRDEFLATMSHELRTPLTAVLGWAAMLRARQGDAAYVARGLATIERNARAQAQLIEELLDLSRVVTGKLRLDVRAVDLRAVIESALDTIGPAASAKNIAIHPVLDPDAGLIMGDANRLQQVANNLLTNAVKFTPKGGRVRVYLRRVESSVEIVVNDNGEGIPSEFLPMVFERFRQADGSMTRAHGGLGLGLGIARSLVELHGGTIEAHSEGTGCGATFTVRIPVAPVLPNAAPRTMPPPPTQAPPTDLKCPSEIDGLRILVVDDEPDTRELIAAVLEHCGATVTTVSTALDALRQLEHAPYDALVSDLGMPGSDGLSLIRKVRALTPEHGGRIPAVALTAYASAQDRTRALTAGFTNHVAKPVDPQELVAVIAALAGRHAQTT